MKNVLISIIMSLVIAVSASAFDGFEYEPVTVNASTVQIPIAVNICNYNSDAQMVACPILEVDGFVDYLLTDVKLKVTGVNENNNFEFDVVSGKFKDVSEVENLGENFGQCGYNVDGGILTCNELTFRDSFGTLSNKHFSNVVFKLNQTNGKKISLINFQVKPIETEE